MIRGAVRLAFVGAGIGYALDRIADLASQPRWMTEMRGLRVLTDGPIGVGTVAEADVRMFGITVTDPVTITIFEPPMRYAISHDGTFRGHGLITLESGADLTTTIVRWEEVLIPPLLPHLGALAMAPALGAIFQADLGRLKELVETGSTSD